MPSVCRRIVVLLVVALIGVGGPVASAFAQSGGGAGDQQYEDPFGGGDSSGSGSSGSRNRSSGSSDSGAQPLTQAPQSSGSSGSSGSSSSGSGTSGASSSGSGTSASGTATAAPSAQATGTLPNTGLDARILVLAGVVLVIAGLGLRMRNAPERF